MPGIRLNERDIRVLADLGEHGILDFDLCHSRHFSGLSRERCRQKLALYAETGLIRATKLQVWYADESRDWRSTGGRIPTLYCLTDRGAKTVNTWTGQYPARVLRSDPSPTTFFHRLHIVKVRVAIDAAAAQLRLAAPGWIMEQDVRPGATTDARPNQRRLLYHEFPSADGTITCQPDAALRLSIPNPATPSRPTDLGIFFEIDLAREGLAQIRRKVPGYTALLSQQSFPYWSDLTDAVLRVFWIVPSDRRLRELLHALRDFPIADRFRLTTFACCDHAVLTATVWHDVHGQKRSVVTQR